MMLRGGSQGDIPQIHSILAFLQLFQQGKREVLELSCCAAFGERSGCLVKAE